VEVRDGLTRHRRLDIPGCYEIYGPEEAAMITHTTVQGLGQARLADLHEQAGVMRWSAPLAGRAARQRQAAGPTRSPDRRLRGSCVAGRRATQGDVSADEEADRGGVGVAGHRGTTSTMCPAGKPELTGNWVPGGRCCGAEPAIPHPMKHST
jgi:hypothetical protein